MHVCGMHIHAVKGVLCDEMETQDFSVVPARQWPGTMELLLQDPVIYFLTAGSYFLNRKPIRGNHWILCV